MPRRTRLRIPLAHRLPNAPATFVGREREIDWLEGAMARGPVALITGPGGIGKTSLVLRAIATRFPECLDRTLFVGIRPGEPADQLRLDLVRMLSKVLRRKVDLGALAGDPEALIEEAIDLADSGGFMIVLDDIHHCERGEMRELLTQLVSYARESRFICTSRMALDVSVLAGQSLPIGAMDEAALTRLARDVSPGAPDGDLHRAVTSAAGSPWLLLQYATTGQAGLSLSRAQLMEGLAPGVEPFLEVLSLLRAPFGPQVLSALAALPSAEMLSTLERRGLIQRSEGGLRLHGIVSALLFPEAARNTERNGLRVRVATLLADMDDADAWVEAARLFADAGAFADLVVLLDTKAQGIFAAGIAPRLWAVIGDVRDPRIASHQLRCASEMGNPTALASVDAPADPGLEDQLAWAKTVYAQGDVAGAQTLAGEVAERATGPEHSGILCSAAILRARCLVHDGSSDRASRELTALQPVDPHLRFLRDALLVRCRAECGAADIDPQLSALRGRETSDEGIDGLLDLAVALHVLGRRESADEQLDVLLATPRGGRASMLVARQALLLRARIRLEAGDLVEAGDLLDSVRPYVRSTSLLRPFVLECDGARRFAVGDLAGLAGSLETAEREAVHVDRDATHRIATLRERLAMVQGRDPGRHRSSPLIDASGPAPTDDVLRLVRARRAARFGDEAVASPARVPTSTRGAVEAALYDLDQHLLAGRGAMAIEAGRRGVNEAARAGRRLLELEARLSLVDAEAVAGTAESYRASLRALEEVGRSLSSPRAQLNVRLHEGAPEPAVLEHIAGYGDVAPVAARRARALLGGADPLDGVDQRVFDAFRLRRPDLSITTVLGDGAPTWRSGWGLDRRTKSVWFPDGRTVDLSNKALGWRILQFLVSVGGAAAKEAMVLGVWEENGYHPGRHDPRLHMSIRKLRELIEDDPSQPGRLVTLEEGYGLRGVVRVAEER